MKKLFYLFLGIILFISVVYIRDCSDVTITAISFSSTFQSNSCITATLGGASVQNPTSKQHSLNLLQEA
ncbi:hypothetical protein [Dysgonomonas macrotermitis]|uniref:Uncharacterized protein n=1 Tax=Dysgonomonas macrotermitis TaxID=1346286 RepID=A0A1M4TVS8_9BACT|nr:hypothetical protein [Dysgonomonas macrotermitis]SHE48540.1 hypothetical protein SAMN05444362_101433 [Dysgonomonas macrotermitis]